MTEVERFLAEAETWIGTPYRHQANPGIKGVATDCVGFLRGVAAEMGYLDGYNLGARYPRTTSGALRKLLTKYMIEVEDLQPGDVILFGTGNDEHHIGIYTGKSIIHAHEGVGRVLRTGYSGALRAQTRGVFRIAECIE